MFTYVTTVQALAALLRHRPKHAGVFLSRWLYVVTSSGRIPEATGAQTGFCTISFGVVPSCTKFGVVPSCTYGRNANLSLLKLLKC
jgi:hypothetical protein